MNKRDMMTYQETIDYLYTQLPQFQTQGAVAYKPGLDRVERLLTLCGSPQDKLATIHVAGTNGKGSTSTMLAAILSEAGYKVGLFTSPHLVDFRERIRVDGEMIPERDVIRFVTEIRPKIPNDLEPSFFELTTAMALAYFVDVKVDVAVIEVGMGGRLDSTNVVHPLISVITNVSMDHGTYLGTTLPQIAYEKAGIIKRNTPIVLGQSSIPEVYSVIKSRAEEMGASLICADREILINGYIKLEDGGYRIITQSFGTFELPLSGDYQLQNIATVLQVLTLLRKTYDVPNDAVRKGVARTHRYGLRGRLELLIKGTPQVYIDTGHNPGAWDYLHEELQSWSDDGGLICVIGMASDKDVYEVLSLMPKEARYIFCKAKGERSMSADMLYSEAVRAGLKLSSVTPDVLGAYHQALDIAKEECLRTVFIGGSNFVIGELLSQI